MYKTCQSLSLSQEAVGYCLRMLLACFSERVCERRQQPAQAVVRYPLAVAASNAFYIFKATCRGGHHLGVSASAVGGEHLHDAR